MLSVLQREGRVVHFEATMQMRSGELYDGLASVEVVQTPRRRLRIIATIDITARKRADAALIDAMVSADRANQAKSEFVSRMSHELRTPLNVILGFAQVLRLDSLDPGQDEAVGHILGAGRHLLDLINDVLDLSRMEAGKISYSIEPVLVAEVIEDSLSLIQPLARDRQITTRFIPDGGPNRLFAMSDRQRLKQVMLNLLSNAVKYNREHGLVTVTCGLTDSGEVRIQVADTGPGISAEKLALLFQPFERLGAEATAVQGTGLGLALSKRFVEAMGGTIGAEAKVGEGTRFWVDLPSASYQQSAEPGEAAAAPQPLPAPLLRPATVLYIEDNLASFELVERVLAWFRTVELMPAAQGRIGIDLALMHRPDLILLDLNLPDILGEEVLQALKAHPATRRTPVVIVSADASAGQIARLKEAGAFAYVTKPLDVREFLAVIGRALGDEYADGEG
jgi:signal transduction histidine kinase/ActR/RegA family two-component response regulator